MHSHIFLCIHFCECFPAVKAWGFSDNDFPRLLSMQAKASTDGHAPVSKRQQHQACPAVRLINEGQFTVRMLDCTPELYKNAYKISNRLTIPYSSLCLFSKLFYFHPFLLQVHLGRLAQLDLVVLLVSRVRADSKDYKAVQVHPVNQVPLEILVYKVLPEFPAQLGRKETLARKERREQAAN